MFMPCASPLLPRRVIMMRCPAQANQRGIAEIANHGDLDDSESHPATAPAVSRGPALRGPAQNRADDIPRLAHWHALAEHLPCGPRGALRSAVLATGAPRTVGGDFADPH